MSFTYIYKIRNSLEYNEIMGDQYCWEDAGTLPNARDFSTGFWRSLTSMKPTIAQYNEIPYTSQLTVLTST